MENLKSSADNTGSIFKSAWDQAKSCRPEIKPNTAISERAYRGEKWYVLQLADSPKLYRINATAWIILKQCNGKTPLSDILQRFNQQIASGSQTVSNTDTTEPLSPDQLLETITQFAFGGIVSIPGMDLTAFQKHAKGSQSAWQKLKNPMSVRFPLWNPDRFLLKHLDLIRPLFSKTALLCWVALVSIGLVLTGSHWSEITNDVTDRLFQPDNLIWLWMIYPVTKFIHEMGHAFATRIHGGSVPDIGIMILFGVPLPYVDASAASAFAEKRHKLLVDAIGIMVELAIATLALMIWLNVQPGLIKQFAYNTMIICSISSLLFNGNPLARFDGYYLLADYLEIPNLAGRAQLYWRYLLKRYLLRADNDRFDATEREKTWLFFYGIGSLIYRIFLLCVVIWAAAQFHLLLGFLVAAFLLYQSVFIPLRKLILVITQQKQSQQQRAIITASLATIVAVTIFVVPFPAKRVLTGVVWMPDQAEIRSQTEGFIKTINITDGSEVIGGTAIVELEDPKLNSLMSEIAARLAELETRYLASRFNDPTEAALIHEEIKSVREEKSNLLHRISKLTVTTNESGHFYFPPAAPASINQLVRQGDLIGYVLDKTHSETGIIRVVINQDDAGLIQHILVTNPNPDIEVWLGSGSANKALTGRIIRAIPAATKDLPSAVLGSEYGGVVLLDPANQNGRTAIQPWFQMDVEVKLAENPQLKKLWPGSRAWVKIHLDREPLGTQLFRNLRQVFMRGLSI